MKHFYLTSLVLALMSVLPASGQVNAKEFPLSSWGESILKSAPQIPIVLHRQLMTRLKELQCMSDSLKVRIKNADG